MQPKKKTVVKPSQIVKKITSQGEFRLRITLANLFNKQRRELPIRRITQNNNVPIDLIDRWEGEFIDWFQDRTIFWRNLWDKSIKLKRERKLTSQEAFDDFIEQRSAVIGLQLAAVNAKTIDNALRLHSVGSVQRLDRALRQSIGLRPDQMNAFARESRIIAKRFPNDPAKVKAITDRIYQKKLNFRAQLIARTEISTGINLAQVADINSRIETGDLPQTMEKFWSTIGDDIVSDLCLINEDEGWIPLDKEFPSGHEQPPRFPSCRCGLQFRAAREAA